MFNGLKLFEYLNVGLHFEYGTNALSQTFGLIALVFSILQHCPVHHVYFRYLG